MIVDLYGLEDRYEISDHGEIFAKAATRIRSDGVVRSFKQRRVRTKINDCGYETVSLFNGTGSVSFKVHRLVMLSFAYVPGCELLDVNHKNGVKLGNNRSNLEWATRSENIAHSYQVLGRIAPCSGKFGADHHRAIGVLASKDGEVIHQFDSLMDAQRAGFNAGHISNCIAGKRKRHKGLTWAKTT